MSISKKQLGTVLSKYQQPGIYVILFLQTKKIYIGETKNFKNWFSETRKILYNGNHSCKELLYDVEKYGIDNFCFIPLYYGNKWEDLKIRLEAEQKLIGFNSSIVYNTQHAAKTKQKKENPRLKERSNLFNGFPRRFSIEGQVFESLGSVRNKFAISRKEIIRRVNDNENFPDWQLFEEDSDFPEKVYFVNNKVFNSERSILRHPDFQMLSRYAVRKQFESENYPEWQIKTKKEFFQLKEENPRIIFEFMWQRSNDHPLME